MNRIKCISLSLTLCLTGTPLLAMAAAPATPADNGSPFGSATEFAPLVNPNSNPNGNAINTPNPASVVQKSAPAGGLSPSMEENIKPMTPFVEGVEKKLGITINTPKGQTPPTLVDRLNHIQEVLFGGRL